MSGFRLDRRTVTAGALLAPFAAGTLAAKQAAPVDQELADLDARTVAAHIRTGALSAERYATALIARHKANLGLNTAIAFDESFVLEQAHEVDRNEGLPGADSDLLALGMAVETVLGQLPPPPPYLGSRGLAIR